MIIVYILVGLLVLAGIAALITGYYFFVKLIVSLIASKLDGKGWKEEWKNPNNQEIIAPAAFALAIILLIAGFIGWGILI